MSSENPMESVSKGVAKAVIEWTEQKVKEYVLKFKNRNVAFVQDPETIEVAIEQRKTSEWDLFQKYVEDERLHILFQMGLTLRRVENNRKQLEKLRERIVRKYDSEGLHVAQFVQEGFFGTFIGNILDRAKTPPELTFEIENLFKNIEITTSFIQNSDNVDKEVETIVVRIQSHSPKTYIIFSSKSAMEKCETIKEKVMEKISGYSTELYKTETKQIYFLNKTK